MRCPRCGAELPDVAHFCHVCGLDLRSGDQARRRSFAAKPDEPVASFALVSSIMPRGAGQRPQTYRIALGIALLVALLAAILGALPIAILVAAFAVPIVYIVYLYDVNLWEDEPLPVTGLAFGLTGLLAIGFTVVVRMLRGPTYPTTALDGSTIGGPTLGTFLLLAVLVPVVGEIIRQVGPLILASRPEFDDLMDGLTFGVVSGVAYACFDTLVRYWDLFTGGLVERDPGLWVSLIFLHGFVKPLLMGTATGIACAEYSGLGRGYDGFTPRYFRGLAEAIAANIAFQAGVYLFGFVGDDTLAVMLSLGWSLLILAILILRVRNVLHTGLMEAALERSAREAGMGPAGELSVCAACEMPLMEHAAFCNACGTAVRAQGKLHRAAVPAAVTVPAAPAPTAAAEAQPVSALPVEDTEVLSRPDPGARGDAGESPPDGGPPADQPLTGEQARDRYYDDEEGRA